MVTGCLRLTEVTIFVAWNSKVFLAWYGKYGILSINDNTQIGGVGKDFCDEMMDEMSKFSPHYIHTIVSVHVSISQMLKIIHRGMVKA